MWVQPPPLVSWSHGANSLLQRFLSTFRNHLKSSLTSCRFRTGFMILLIISVMADGLPKRGLAANDDILITVSAV